VQEPALRICRGFRDAHETPSGPVARPHLKRTMPDFAGAIIRRCGRRRQEGDDPILRQTLFLRIACGQNRETAGNHGRHGRGEVRGSWFVVRGCLQRGLSGLQSFARPGTRAFDPGYANAGLWP
jgi:hypothetical protein